MEPEQPNEFSGFRSSTTRLPFPWIHAVLFLATVGSTLLAGAFLTLGYNQPDLAVTAGIGQMLWERPGLLIQGVPFAAALMTILLAHEMGHYLTCRHYGIAATLPYFIPAPTPVGTLGAFIKIRAPFHHRAALLEVGVAGPIAGFVMALPILAVALTQSRFETVDPAGAISLGEPLVFKLVMMLMGVVPPEGMELYIHPVAFAAWVGLLVTALNLLPVGQLDGGHVAYAVFGRHHRRISQVFVVILLPMGIFLWPGWLIWIVLLALLGTRHPPTLDDSRPLQRRQVVLGWIGLAVFVLCFMPVPAAVG